MLIDLHEVACAEAQHRLDQMLPGYTADQVLEEAQQTGAESVDELLEAHFPEEIPAARTEGAGNINDRDFFWRVGNTVLQCIDVHLGKTIGEVPVTFGRTAPFYSPILEDIAQARKKKDGLHLLAGFSTQDSAREHYLLNSLHFPEGKTIAMDLTDAIRPDASYVATKGNVLDMPFDDESLATIQTNALLHMLVKDEKSDGWNMPGYVIKEERSGLVRQFLKESARVLESGGSMVMAEYDLASPLFGSTRQESTITPEQMEAIEEFKFMAEKAGFVVISKRLQLPSLERDLQLGILGLAQHTDTEPEVAIELLKNPPETTLMSNFVGFHLVKR